ncbi:hypothetical protein AMJ85_03490 [candidate division BRC1 bacterium SM23_51]|nr:MAG: hypothetical protein AMJ85_03490 [candidate division BRC1 bacterium SM23_51]
MSHERTKTREVVTIVLLTIRPSISLCVDSVYEAKLISLREQWKWARHLELSSPGQGSHSYLSIIEARDGTIHVTHGYHLPRGTVGRNHKFIKHAAFNESRVMAGDPVEEKAN